MLVARPSIVSQHRYVDEMLSMPVCTSCKRRSMHNEARFVDTRVFQSEFVLSSVLIRVRGIDAAVQIDDAVGGAMVVQC